jgi:hypothetical protein
VGNFPNRDQPTGEILDRLPGPANREERERIAKLHNPTVAPRMIMRRARDLSAQQS